MRRVNWVAVLSFTTILVAVAVGLDVERASQAVVLALCAIALAILSFRE